MKIKKIFEPKFECIFCSKKPSKFCSPNNYFSKKNLREKGAKISSKSIGGYDAKVEWVWYQITAVDNVIQMELV